MRTSRRDDLNTAPPMPQSYGYMVCGAVYTYVGGFGGSITLGLIFKVMSDSWLYALGAALAGILTIMCIALLIFVPMSLIGSRQLIREASRTRTIVVTSPQPEGAQ
jgi:hypothetical protein